MLFVTWFLKFVVLVWWPVIVWCWIMLKFISRRGKVRVVDEPDRTALTQAWKSWMEEHIQVTGKVPPGNESGNTTWVRQPPKKKKPDLWLIPGRNVQLTVPLEELTDKLVKENKVVAFIKGSRGAPMRGFSQRVIGIPESEGVDCESVDVLDEEYNHGLRETLKNYSNWPTFPANFREWRIDRRV